MESAGSSMHSFSRNSSPISEMINMTIERPEILDRVKALGFSTFESGADYDLNIIGERNPRGRADHFDDWLSVIYTIRGIWHHEIFACTTDPGLYWLNNPGRVEGTAILKHPQQMRGAYTIRKHRGKYDALCQDQAVTIWRDRNMDNLHDFSGPEYRGFYGINIHRAGLTNTERVGRYSAGCTVIKESSDFQRLMYLCRMQITRNSWPNFTYTLIEGL